MAMVVVGSENSTRRPQSLRSAISAAFRERMRRRASFDDIRDGYLMALYDHELLSDCGDDADDLDAHSWMASVGDGRGAHERHSRAKPQLLNPQGQRMLEAAFAERPRARASFSDFAYGYLCALKDHELLRDYTIRGRDPFALIADGTV